MLYCGSCCCPAWCAAHGSLQDCTVILLYVQILLALYKGGLSWLWKRDWFHVVLFPFLLLAFHSLGVLKVHYLVVCAMVGSLGALYTGLVLANLALALFALVAVESSNQTLCRVYGFLLAFALLLDIVWFILFTSEIRHFSKDSQVGKFGMFSIKLVFLMQATGCALRFVSSCLWIRIYRIGAATDTSSRYQPVEFSRRITNLGAFYPASPSVAINSRSTSMSDALLGGAIYHPGPSSHESCTDAVSARPTSLTDELLKAIYNPATFNILRQSSSDEDSAESSEPPVNTAPPFDYIPFTCSADFYDTTPTFSPDVEHDPESKPVLDP